MTDKPQEPSDDEIKELDSVVHRAKKEITRKPPLDPTDPFFGKELL